MASTSQMPSLGPTPPFLLLQQPLWQEAPSPFLGPL